MTATSLPAPPPPGWRSFVNGRTLSWAAYDLANTAFSMNIVSLYLPLWVVNVAGGSDATWGYANSASMVLMLLTAPFLGALSDQAGRRLPFLLASTLGCVALTAALGSGGLGVTLALFMAANYLFQAGLIFYDATLPTVSTPRTRGRVGGLGIALGYLGSFLGVSAGLLFLERCGYVFVFRLTALLFLVFALPLFLVVREPRGPRAAPPGVRARRAALHQVRDTLGHVRRYRGLARFLLGRACYTEAANTLIIFMGVYVTAEVGFSEREAQVLLLAAIAAAVLGGLLFGRAVDRVGPRRALNAALGLWVVALGGAVAVAAVHLPRDLFWGVGVVAGLALGGTWSADRPYMLLLSPPRRLGEFYGLYSLVGRFAAVVGPALWAFTATTLGLGRPAAVAVLLALVIAAYLILRRVDDAPRVWSPEEETQSAVSAPRSGVL